MRTQFVAQQNVVEGGVVVSQKAVELDMSEVFFAIRQLKRIYNQDPWKLETWMENFHGKKFIDFEMEAHREIEGMESTVRFSIIRKDDSIRRFNH